MWIKILLVEDNPADADLLAELLEVSVGVEWELVPVEFLHEAIAHLSKQPFDVVLLDLSLPDSRGLETLTRLQEVAPDTAMVVMTGLDDEAIALESVRLGAQDYIVKGQITTPLLVRTIRYAIERSQTFQMLKESERRFRAIFDSSFQLTKLLTPEGIVLEVNETALEFTEMRSEDVVGSPIWKQPIWEQSPKAKAQLKEGVIKAGMGEFFRTEMDFLGKNNQIITVDFSLKPVKNETGQVLLLIAEARDISDRKRAEEQLQQTNQELARATRLKDEFLANMSHELRTPLNAILGMTEGLQEQVFGTISDRQRKALQTIESSGTHLLELINDILDVSKIVSGQITLDYAPTSITHLCQSSLTFIKQQAHQKRIQIHPKLQQNLPDLFVDERRIRQVLINLLNNAVKFTPEGGSITLEVGRHKLIDSHAEGSNIDLKEFLEIKVIDTGIGIAAEDIQKLFKPFIQIDSALNRQYEGTGLGLALVKQLVELHDGQVGLTSELGVGSCFSILLPYARNMSLSPEALIGNEPDVTSTLEALDKVGLQSPLILIAEDNQSNIMTISSYLVAKGYRIVLAYNGQEAIAMATSAQPDLILMDIQMPIMDGLEATKQIRQIPSLVNVPIIALTALAMEADRDRCIAAGANEYLSKPVKLKQLVSTIHQLLAH